MILTYFLWRKYYRDFAEARKAELDSSLIAFINSRNHFYLQNCVNAYLDMETSASSSNNKRLPSIFKGKLDNFNKTSPAAVLQEGMKELMMKSLNIGEMLQELKKLLEKEKADDMEFRNHFKHLWNRSPSEILNAEYYQALQGRYIREFFFFLKAK